MQINIYYESIEQGLYLKNTLEKQIVRNNDEIFLVKFKKINKPNKSYASSINSILLRKNPDILISVVKNDIENPIVMMEFSTAVFTKDHELQRSDNIVVAKNNNCVFIKVSPLNKYTDKEHGGDTKYNFIEQYSLFYKKYNELAFHINWDNSCNTKYLDRDDIFLTVPRNNLLLVELLSYVYQTINQSDYTNWKKHLLANLKSSVYFNKWIEKLEVFKSEENIQKFKSNRMIWEKFNKSLSEKDVLNIKINRMGHAMDPERGLLHYYGSLYRDQFRKLVAKFEFNKNTVSWYKQTSPKAERYIKDKLENINEISKYHLIDFLLYGLSIPNIQDFVNECKKYNYCLVNIDKYLTNNYLSINNSFRSIIDNCDYLHISDGKSTEVYLMWDKNLYLDIKYDLKQNHKKNITELKIRNSISEDDVTYIIIHNIFKLNKINVIDVSYPGARSDRPPLLPEPQLGKAQRRIYNDIVAYSENKIIFHENKGIFNLKAINADINKVSKLKTDSPEIDAVYKFAENENLKVEKIIVGVGFAKSPNMTKSFDLIEFDKVDYFILINVDNNEWKIFSNIDDSLFEKKSGIIDLPLTYELV